MTPERGVDAASADGAVDRLEWMRKRIDKAWN
jgi:hypothetical protein